MTLEVVLLALAASGFTALASVAQRSAAAPAPGELSFSWRLVAYLVHRPVWFLGILSMILGFVFQVWALRMGSLSLVQPIIATELVVVFGIMALQDRHRVQARDWMSALGIVVGLGAFLALARPSNGHQHPSAFGVGPGWRVYLLAGGSPRRTGLPAGPIRRPAQCRTKGGTPRCGCCDRLWLCSRSGEGAQCSPFARTSWCLWKLVAVCPAPFRGGGLLLGLQRLPSRVARCLPAGSDHRRPTGGQHAGRRSLRRAGSTSVQRHSVERYWRSPWFWSA